MRRAGSAHLPVEEFVGRLISMLRLPVLSVCRRERECVGVATLSHPLGFGIGGRPPLPSLRCPLRSNHPASAFAFAFWRRNQKVSRGGVEGVAAGLRESRGNWQTAATMRTGVGPQIRRVIGKAAVFVELRQIEQ